MNETTPLTTMPAAANACRRRPPILVRAAIAAVLVTAVSRLVRRRRLAGVVR